MLHDIQLVTVLDYLAHGREGDESPQYRKPQLLQVIKEEGFVPCELVLKQGPLGTIGDPLNVNEYPEYIESIREIKYEDLSVGAKSELERNIREIIQNNSEKFVDFFNNSNPISIRLHQLNLLPGIGGKIRDRILNSRKYSSFESFEDLEEKIEGLYNPQEIILNRILDELKNPDIKYHIFVNTK